MVLFLSNPNGFFSLMSSISLKDETCLCLSLIYTIEKKICLILRLLRLKISYNCNCLSLSLKSLTKSSFVFIWYIFCNVCVREWKTYVPFRGNRDPMKKYLKQKGNLSIRISEVLLTSNRKRYSQDQMTSWKTLHILAPLPSLFI